jgi:DNA uptake protein ComE-like DNA-binding protein
MLFRPAALAASRSAVAIGLVAALAACSGSAASTSSPVATTGSSAVATSSAAATTSGKVSANTATSAELVAALTAAGVPNADRWAREVMEYRPYDTSDPTLQHLQDNLAKYNPDPATLAAILSALTP